MTHPTRSIMITAALLSAGLAAVGAAVLARPSLNPLAGEQATIDGLAGLLPDTAAGAVLLIIGLLGVAGAVFRTHRAATLLGGTQTVAVGLLLISAHLIQLLGYLMAAIVPLGAVTLAVLAVHRYAWARFLVAGLTGVAAIWGAVTGVLAPANVAAAFGRVGTASADQAGGLAVQLILAATFVASLLVLVARSTGSPLRTRFEDWLLRHRHALTYVAAAGPLPYFLLRMTWLTPWPVGAPGGLDSPTRLWGLLLGCGGLVGSVLTVGLVRRWGRIAPRWWPVGAGRPVPVAAAVVPGLTVAAALTAAAVPMILSAFDPTTVMSSPVERVLYLVVFPFGIWGPALALAVAAYAVSRERETTVPAAEGVLLAG